MQVLSPAPIQVSISLLEKLPESLEQLLRDASPVVLQWKPAPERWSIQEVLAHLAVIEQLYSERVRRIVMEEDLAKYVAPSESEVHQKTARQLLEHFIAWLRAHVVFLHNVPAAAGRTGRHYEMGSISVSQLLHELASHDLGHVRQLAELYRARAFYPHAEPFQKFSHPKP
jgi:DinB superfamily